jgi:fluoroquinolone resistance protein
VRDPDDAPSFAEREFTGNVHVAPGSAFERCTFRSANLQSADLARCRFLDCRFAGSNLSVARVAGAVFQDASFRDCKLTGIDWAVAQRIACLTFEACVLDECAFVNLDLRDAVFRRCRLRDAVFADIDLSGADFREAELTGAQFLRTKLVGADLRGARGYVIHPAENDVKGLRASMPDAAGLVTALGVVLEL